MGNEKQGETLHIQTRHALQASNKNMLKVLLSFSQA